MAGIEIPIVATYSGKGVSQAESSLSKLGSSAMKTLAGVASVTAALGFAKSAISAFANEQKQQAIMLNTLSNQGWGDFSTMVEDAIQKMRLATGVSADELRPAFDQLFLATGSATKSLSALNVAMDVSKGTGKDLNTVAEAMSKGFLGNTTSLTRLGAGLDKAVLATGNMDLIVGELQRKLGRSAAIAATTFSSQMAILGQNVEVAKESIGSHLVGAIAKATGKDGIGGMTGIIDGLTAALNEAIDKTGTLIEKMTKLGSQSHLFGKGAFEVIFGKDYKPIGSGSSSMGKAGQASPGGAGLAAEAARLARLPKPKTPLTATEIKSAQTAKEKLAVDKAHLAIQKLSNNFDLKRIELNAVLMSNATDSQKASAQAQLNLMDAQDKLTLNTLAGSGAALALANAGLAELTIKEKLSAETNNTIAAITGTGVTIKGFADSLVSASAQIMSAASSWQTFRAGERGVGTGGLPSTDQQGSAYTNSNGSDRAGGVSPTVIIQTPAILDSNTINPAVQEALDALARNGYVSARSAGTNGWQ